MRKHFSQKEDDGLIGKDFELLMENEVTFGNARWQRTVTLAPRRAFPGAPLVIVTLLPAL